MKKEMIVEINRLINERKNTKSIIGRKPILLVDQDDVLACFIDKVLEIYNKRYGTNYKNEDITDWNLDNILGKEVLEIMYDPNIFVELSPIVEGIETIKLLLEKNMFDVYIVTAAHPSTCFNKFLWVRGYMPFFNSNHIIFTYQKHLVNGDVLIDDGLHNVLGFKDRYTILVNTSRNKDFKELPEKCTRAYNWLDITNTLLDIFYPKEC